MECLTPPQGTLMKLMLSSPKLYIIWSTCKTPSPTTEFLIQQNLDPDFRGLMGLLLHEYIYIKMFSKHRAEERFRLVWRFQMTPGG